MRILITGAGGFIGSSLIKALVDAGYHVSALARTPGIPQERVTWTRWQLGQSVLPAVTDDTVAAIHLAHDFSGADGAELTLRGTAAAIDQLHSAGLARQIFFSSYSAGPHAISRYGRTKTELEKRILAVPGGIVVRPGLVLGDGGIYGRIRRVAHISPVVPLPDSGRGLVPVITSERLCEEVIQLVQGPVPKREFNLYDAEMVSLRNLTLQAASERGRRPVILPVPSGLLMAVLKAADRIGWRLPVNADSLQGFLSNQTAVHQEQGRNVR